AQMSSDPFRDPLLSSIATYRQHEGDRAAVCRSDGSWEHRAPETMAGKIVIDSREVDKKGERAIREAFSKAHEEIAETSKTMFETRMKEWTEEAGTAFDFGGRPFTADLYLASLENVEFEFDESGNWKEPDWWSRTPNLALLKRITEELDR